MAKRRKVSNILALSLLSLLMQQPMYPYEMASTLRRWGKDQSAKINWGSLYTVVQNLEKHGFIEATGSAREGRQPERTTYQITEAGTAELRDWMRELLSVPEREYPKFESALSDALVLPPDEVVSLLTERLEALDAANAKEQQDLELWSTRLPRLVLIETEYHLAMQKAEADWVRGLLKEIAEGALPGVDVWRQVHETGEFPPELVELAERGWEPDK
jgi:DNA-binding PadR family transcriptional regulator